MPTPRLGKLPLVQIQQQARFEQEETGNGSLRFASSPERAARAAGSGLAGAAYDEDTNAFQKRILQIDEATLQDQGVLPADGGLIKPTKNSEALRKGKRLTSGQRGSLARGGDEENNGEWKEIPFSWVVRGRQESHLVGQQVRFLGAAQC